MFCLLQSNRLIARLSLSAFKGWPSSRAISVRSRSKSWPPRNKKALETSSIPPRKAHEPAPDKLDESQVLFCDKHVMVVNKPSGVLSQGDRTGDGDITGMAQYYIKHKFFKPGHIHCQQVHRLDRPVSGSMMLALSGRSADKLSSMLSERSPLVHKVYYAVVHGKMLPGGTAEAMLLPQGGKGQRTRVLAARFTEALGDEESARTSQTEQQGPISNFATVSGVKNPDARLAVLDWHAVHATEVDGGGYETLVRITMKTGRKHQIRAQLSHMGHPVKGDVKYGAPGPQLPSRSIGLHSRVLVLPHPIREGRGKTAVIACSSPLPSEWRRLCSAQMLRKGNKDAEELFKELTQRTRRETMRLEMLERKHEAQAAEAKLQVTATRTKSREPRSPKERSDINRGPELET